jgi:hypothetical protein
VDRTITSMAVTSWGNNNAVEVDIMANLPATEDAGLGQATEFQ